MSPYTPQGHQQAAPAQHNEYEPAPPSSTMATTFNRLLSRKRRKYLGIVLFVGAMIAIWDVNVRRAQGETWTEDGLGSPAAGLGGKIWGDVFGGKSPSIYEDDEEDGGAWGETSHGGGSHSDSHHHPAAVVEPVVVNPEHALGRHPVSNGLLEVDLSLPAAKHPIYQLITDAQKEWDAKVARQSKTLEEAVKEYARRNKGRKPPKGFDKWWDYVQKHKVTLPDEFDLIMRDLNPFLAYSPTSLRGHVRKMTSWKDTFTVSIRGGKLEAKFKNYDAAKIGGSNERVAGQLSHIEKVAEWIPDMDAVFNIHDTPLSFVSAAHKAELEDLVEEGEYFDADEEADRSFSTWGAACPISSPLHKLHPKLGTDPSSLLPNLTLLNVPFTPSKLFTDPSTKSFISSHVSNMDLCNHPDIISLHGTTSGTKPKPQAELLPVFSLSKTGLHSDISVVPMEQWGEKQSGDFKPFAQKKVNKLLWRGRNTGAFYSNSTPWRSFHRSRLAALAMDDIKEKIAVLPAPLSQERSVEEGTLEKATAMVGEGELNQRLFDVGLAYDPTQCSVEDGTCEEIKKELPARPSRTFAEENDYQYILDVDGNSWSARYKRLLSTGSLILKSTIFPEWWNDRMQPWLHYVPVKVDYGDLYDIMTFFRGDGVHPGEEKLAQMIADSGNAWSTSSWRREDMTAYMFRLYLEWARLLALDRRSMDFTYKP